MAKNESEYTLYAIVLAMNKEVRTIDKRIIEWLERNFLPFARIAIFVTYFYFGMIKLSGHSAISPLATELTTRTVGLNYFSIAFTLLAVYECLIGIFFLFPKMTRVVIPMLLGHMLIVCSPLFLLHELTWSKPLVPTLEGQYIIKNVIVIALAMGIAAQTPPIKPEELN